MIWQLARFIVPDLSVFHKVVWVRGIPGIFATKHSETVDGIITRGEYEGTGFPTNVLGREDRLPMIAYLEQIELLPVFAGNVAEIEYDSWKSLPDKQIEELGK